MFVVVVVAKLKKLGKRKERERERSFLVTQYCILFLVYLRIVSTQLMGELLENSVCQLGERTKQHSFIG